MKLEKSLADVKEKSEKDDDGLLVVDGDAACVRMFGIVFKHESKWQKYPLLVSFMETMIRYLLFYLYVCFFI